MDRERADNIIYEYNLVSGKVSRNILRAIVDGQAIDDCILPEGVTISQIEKIKLAFLEKAAELGNVKTPKNIAFYHLLSEKFPEFSWNFRGDENSDNLPSQIELKTPRIRNLRPSLLSLLLDHVDKNRDTDLHRRFQCCETLPTTLTQDLSIAMEKMDVIYPNEEGMQHIVNWLFKGIQGETLTVFSPICPDYSAVETGDPDCPLRHTFDHLGTGIGAIAQRILKASPLFESVLNKYKLKVNFIVGLGDFEALSEANLKRVKVSKDEFINCCEKSKGAFQKACLIPVKAYMITAMIGGHQAWLDKFESLKKRLGDGDFGKSTLTMENLLKIIEKRKNLYDRWYGKKKSLEEYLPYVINQGAEYAAVGAIISKFCDSCLILGADNDAMSPFYSIEQTMPVLYLKRYYC